MDRTDAVLHGTGCGTVTRAGRTVVVASTRIPARTARGPYRGSGEERRDARRADMSGTGQPRPHKPALYADLTDMIDAAGGWAPAMRAEIAAATAEAVVSKGRERRDHPGDDRFVALADEVGLDTLAALWRDSDPVSLPGALFALYLLRQWSRTNPDEVTRLWRAGEPLAAAEAAVAGLPDYAGTADIQRVADAVLAGVYGGDLAVALERAAAFFRVVATGRRQLPAAHAVADGADADLAERNDRAAAALSAAARRWREGTLH